MRADILVVGGGPAGCFLAGSLAKRGFDVVVVEEHPEIGKPVSCTGLVGVRGMREVGLKIENFALNELEGGIIVSPSSEILELSRGRVEALVIDRAALDRSLGERAEEWGARIFRNTKCVGVKIEDEPTAYVKGKSSGEIKSELLVGADGPTSLVAKKTGLVNKREFVKCAQTEVSMEARENMVEVYLGQRIAPGFFAWVVPTGETVRIGLGTRRGSPIPKLYSFLKSPPIANRLKGKPGRVSVGLIPLTPPRSIHSNRVLLVGDAACQVKPLTGGGIYFGLSCAKIASWTIAEVLGGKGKLKDYARRVERKFGLEFKIGRRVRRIFEELPDEGIDELVRIFGNPTVREAVLKHADFDHHLRSLRGLVRRTPLIIGSISVRKFVRTILGSLLNV